MNNEFNKANHLIDEKSPYLLQHAYNPVDWYPWGEEAFDKAQRENKPIFLSIGYSTCHWCHVMEHESFEDSTVAAEMNKTFVSIKVDREERPDIDNIYMSVCQMLTGSGGWPLTIIMTQDKKPFFAGTYFPKETRFGRIGMIELTQKIAESWIVDRDKINSSAEQITAEVQNQQSDVGNSRITEEATHNAYEQFKLRFDSNFGGFGSSPKFPSPHNLTFLLRYWKQTGDNNALNMVEKTLKSMRLGGIFDHVGFGFHRYSTDKEWFLPHFEKMLYDQAMLTSAYIETYQATQNIEYANVAKEIIEYVLRDMTSSEGAFYSAEDADSEGIEGKFYVWSVDEIRSILDEKEAQLFITTYNFTQDGNFVEEASKSETGQNIPHLKNDLSTVAKKIVLDESELKKRLESIRQKLFDAREKRVHPYKDDKILTDWNGLMIAALTKTARVLDNNNFKSAAIKAMEFVLTKMKDDDSRLLHRYRDGEFSIQATLDDYAFVIWGLLELYETTFDIYYLKTAVELQEVQNKYFWDETNFGYFLTASDAEKLLTRSKDIYDGAIPSGNSVSFNNLLKLGKLTANSNNENMASQMSISFSNSVNRAPSGTTMMLQGINFALGNSAEVIVVAEEENNATKEIIQKLNQLFIPNKVVLFKTKSNQTELAEIAPFTKDYEIEAGEPLIYVCKNYNCNLPTSEIKTALEMLNYK
ncbi:MAG: thioredoxin domain-containing protein [Bacteroidetes bacterium]|nr:thioredoxin domain-containing protein [Bacteroidota bacterium]MBU1799432.1 thioredoxin domain-containing protein [Bacteroidota bacterium]